MQSSTVEKLQSISFFSEIGEYDLSQIAEITEEKSYATGDIIIEERTAAERFFIIYRGKIEITKKFEDGEEFVLAVHSNGDFFGEMALLDEGPRSATARAVEPTIVLEITRPNFETLLYKAPVMAYHIIRELSSRLRETGALLVSFLQRRNRQLYRAYLDTINMIIRAVEERGPEARAHSRRVQALAMAIGSDLKLSEEEMLTLEINSLVNNLKTESLPEPLRLKPGALAQSIITVAEAYLEMTHDRPAATRLAPAQAIEELGSGEAKKLDPRILRSLRKLLKSGKLPE